LVRLSRRAQKIDKFLAIKRADFGRAIFPGVRNVRRVMLKIFEAQSKSSVRPDGKHLFQLLEEGGLTVGRQPHHFVFVTVMREAEELGERRIKNA
jgi:hypothetical protein